MNPPACRCFHKRPIQGRILKHQFLFRKVLWWMKKYPPRGLDWAGFLYYVMPRRYQRVDYDWYHVGSTPFPPNPRTGIPGFQKLPGFFLWVPLRTFRMLYCLPGNSSRSGCWQTCRWSVPGPDAGARLPGSRLWCPPGCWAWIITHWISPAIS